MVVAIVSALTKDTITFSPLLLLSSKIWKSCCPQMKFLVPLSQSIASYTGFTSFCSQNRQWVGGPQIDLLTIIWVFPYVICIESYVKCAQPNSYAVRVFGTSSKMFAIFVMSCLGPKEYHRSSVGKNETRDQKILFRRNQYSILRKYGRPSIYNASQSTVFIAKMTCKGVSTHRVLKFT